MYQVLEWGVRAMSRQRRYEIAGENTAESLHAGGPSSTFIFRSVAWFGLRIIASSSPLTVSPRIRSLYGSIRR